MFEHDYKNYPELTNEELQTMQFTSPHVQITEDFWAEVVKVHDGDTVTLKTSFRDFEFPLRIANIDAPELSEGGDAAREWLKSKLLYKKVLILIDQSNRVGKYGRLIGLVLADGMSVSEEMLNIGLVKPFGQKRDGEVPDINRLMKEGEIA